MSAPVESTKPPVTPPTAKGTGAAPDENPYAGIPSARRRTFAERLDGLVEPVIKRDGAADQAVKWVKEAEDRVLAIMKLSQYEVELSGKQGKKVLQLASEIQSLRPSASSSVCRAVEFVRDRSFTEVRYDPYGRGCSAVSALLRQKFRDGEELSRDLRDRVKRLDDSWAPPFARPEFPDLETLALRNELTGDYLLAYLFYLDDQAKYIRHHRKRDAELHAAVMAFEKDEDRALILHKMHARHPDWGKEQPLDYAAADKKFELTKRFFPELEKKPVKPARKGGNPLPNDFGGGLQIDPGFQEMLGREGVYARLEKDAKWQELIKKDLLAYAQEREGERLASMARIFADADAAAVADLVALQKAQDELQLMFSALVPSFKYRFRPIIALSPDGKPLEKTLAPIPFKADPKAYVKKIRYGYSDSDKKVTLTYTVELGGLD